jgi:hypothetical protein
VFTEGSETEVINLHNILIYDNFGNEISTLGNAAISTNANANDSQGINSGAVLLPNSTSRGLLMKTNSGLNQFMNITLKLEKRQSIHSIVINNCAYDECKSRILKAKLGIYKNGDLIAKDDITSNIPIITMAPKYFPIPLVSITISFYNNSRLNQQLLSLSSMD